jgi:hypothetical protein
MFLIEKMPEETTGDVQVFLDILLREIYGRRPEWLIYELRQIYQFRGREFVQMFCHAGSVYAQLLLRASTGGGIGRDILHSGTRDGQLRAWLLHHGRESEYDSDEIQKLN